MSEILEPVAIDNLLDPAEWRIDGQSGGTLLGCFSTTSPSGGGN